MPSVNNGYRGDPYTGGGPPPGPSGYSQRQDGYDPYSRGPPREDPYSSRPAPVRDSYAGRTEDPYSTRPNPAHRHHAAPAQNGHAASRLPGPTDDMHYGRYGKQEDPYSQRKPEDPYSQRKPEDPYSQRKPEDPYSKRKPEDPYSQRKPEDPYSQRKPEDPYSQRKPEDPYRYESRPVEDPYSRVHKDRHANGGPRDDYRPHSHEADGASRTFPHYEMDHLATFSVGAKQGLMSPTDGIRKLRQMELSTGIWTMRVTLVIEPNNLIVIDRASGEDMERFPISYITQPTAVTNEDRRDVYNNIVLFTVTEDTRRGVPSEMHMFQCIGKPAHEVVDDIKSSKAGKIRGPSPSREQDNARVSEQIRDFEQHAQHNYNATRDYHQAIPSTQLLKQSMHHDDNESVLSERTDHDVSKEAKPPSDKPEKSEYDNLTVEECQQLLNHCFDDIEKFVGRLQSAAESYRELAARRRQRESQKKHKHPIGDGMLSMRSRPPPASDFIDVFQKFKLSFNLLAKLKPHIHDPNAPELVHFLFTPLSLVVEASKDPRHGTPDIASKVLSPMLTSDAKELLLNCLSSKETDLWYSLGDAWKLGRDEYKDYVPPFFPRFSDGWEPPKSWNADGHQAEPQKRHEDEDPYSRRSNGNGQGPSYSDPPHREEPHDRAGPPQDAHARALAEYEQEFRRREERRHENERAREPERPRDDRQHDLDDQRTMERERERDHNRRSPEKDAPRSFEDEQHDFQQDLRFKNNKMATALHGREGKNTKELTVQKGEIVEVLDSSRNWWKVRNNKGQSGHVPFTILQDMSNKTSPTHDSLSTNDRSPRSVNRQVSPPSSDAASYINTRTYYMYQAPDGPPSDLADKTSPMSTSLSHPDPEPVGPRDDARRSFWQPGDPYYRGGQSNHYDRHAESPRDKAVDHSPREDYNRPEEHPDQHAARSDDRTGVNSYNHKPIFDYPEEGLYDMTDNSPVRDSRSPDSDREHLVQHAENSPERHDSSYQRPTKYPERHNSSHQRPSNTPERHDSMYQRHAKSPERHDSRYQRPAKSPERHDSQYRTDNHFPENTGRYSEHSPDYNRNTSAQGAASPKFSDRIVHNIPRNKIQENITSELKGIRQGGPISPRSFSIPKRPEVYINLHSSRADVQNWLESKGYSPRLQSALSGYDGRDMFELQKNRLMAIGRDEAKSLESQLTVQRNIAGYSPENTHELEALLISRKHDVEP